MRGTPVYLKNLGTVQIGGAIRRGLLEMNGEGEKVGGLVVMRGVEKLNSITTTSAMSGQFISSQSTRGEFLRLIKP